MGTWFNVLIVVLVAALVAAFVGYFTLQSAPTGTYGIQTTITDEEHGTFTATASPPGDDLPDLELACDGTEATVSFAELRAALKLTDEEDKVLKDLIDTWDTLTDAEKADALSNAIDVVIQLVNGHPAELKALILKKAGENEAEGAEE